MTEKPILFSTEMVQAILDGRKTQTRRAVKPQPSHHYDDNCTGDHWFDTGGNNWACSKCGGEIIPSTGGSRIRAPYQPGDILYVRETWTYLGTDKENNPCFAFKANSPHLQNNMYIKWRPSIHMPKDAARIWLEVTNVRVERLQEITEEDAKAEGVMPIYGNDFASEKRHYPSFARLWDTHYAKRGHSWETNPWVWVVEFVKA